MSAAKTARSVCWIQLWVRQEWLLQRSAHKLQRSPWTLRVSLSHLTQDGETHHFDHYWSELKCSCMYSNNKNWKMNIQRTSNSWIIISILLYIVSNSSDEWRFWLSLVSIFWLVSFVFWLFGKKIKCLKIFLLFFLKALLVCLVLICWQKIKYLINKQKKTKPKEQHKGDTAKQMTCQNWTANHTLK